MCPTNVNGLGLPVEFVRNIINGLLDRFPLLEDNLNILTVWLDIVMMHSLKGKRVHDARLAAIAISANIDHILKLKTSLEFQTSTLLLL